MICMFKAIQKTINLLILHQISMTSSLNIRYFKVKLDLLTDIDMLLMVGKGIRT